jgi:hypothetical protein
MSLPILSTHHRTRDPVSHLQGLNSGIEFSANMSLVLTIYAGPKPILIIVRADVDFACVHQ